jgi:hypothetical protein
VPFPDRPAIEQVEGQPGRPDPLLFDWLAHRGEVTQFGERVVVDADHRHRTRYRDAGAPQAAEGTGRDLVAEAEDGGGRLLQAQQSVHAIGAHGGAPRHLHDELRVDGDAGVAERGAVAPQPVGGRRVRPVRNRRRVDHRDPLVSGTDQMIDRLPRRRDVVDAHVRVVEQRAAGDDHRYTEEVKLASLKVGDRKCHDDDCVDLSLHR